MRKNRKANCLRDLYMEDINQAKVLRDSDIIPENEKVLPFSGNNYLTYSTKHQDVSLSCPQIHNEIKHIHEGVSEDQVPIPCALKLENTTIYSIFSP